MEGVSGRVLVHLRESTNRVRQTASKMRRALRQQRDSDKSSAEQEVKMWRMNRRVWRGKTYLITIGSIHKEQKTKLAWWGWLWLHKINNDHDARVMNMMQAGDR